MRRGCVAVLGAGIMGSSVALLLARTGVQVVLVDAAAKPFEGASRFNEGKIHLGYLYLADPSLETARKLIPGGLAFRGRLAALLDCPAQEIPSTLHDDTYLIHRKSVVGSECALERARQVQALCAAHDEAGGYFVPMRQQELRLLTPAELERQADTRYVHAGFQVPERSVRTEWIADRFVAALAAEPGIEQRMGVRVGGVRPGRRWIVQACAAGREPEELGPFDAVVNATWEGMPAIDASLGLVRATSWTHRFRLSIFATTSDPVPLQSAVLAAGPFGDVKNYDGRHLYLSWYPTGLLVESHELRAPAVPVVQPAQAEMIFRTTLEMLSRHLCGMQEVASSIETWRLRGGWVYAEGRGPLGDPASGLHRRDRAGLVARGSYFSVDTGKYSTAPWLAAQVAAAVRGALGR